jgi:hypothetical protein
MIWDSAINSFLASSKLGSATEYARKLRVFNEFIMETIGYSDKNYYRIISSLSTDDILESVVHYINRKGRKKIESCSPVRVYLSAVLEYLKFLNNDENYDVKNLGIDSQQEQSNLRQAFDVKLKELKLKESESDVHITQDECDMLIKKCNSYIGTSDEELLGGDVYNKNYSKFLSSIILKFVLAFGLSSDTLNKLTLADYNSDLNSVMISGYTVYLPDNLAIQMKKYVRIRESIVSDKDKEKLFVRRQSNSKKRNISSDVLSSSIICAVLDEVTGKKSVRSVAKYSIIGMIKIGLPQYLITNLTGHSNEIYNYCLDIANDEPTMDDNRLLDSRLRLLGIYEKL